jgi:hypothetical protein
MAAPEVATAGDQPTAQGRCKGLRRYLSEWIALTRYSPESSERHDVEGVQLHFIVMLPGMQRVEVGDAVHAEYHRLAIDHELPVPVSAGGLHDPGIAVGEVVAAARDQPDAVAVALKAEAVAVVLHFVQPVGAVRDAGRFGGQAEIKGLKHPAEIVIPASFASVSSPGDAPGPYTRREMPPQRRSGPDSFILDSLILPLR